MHDETGGLMTSITEETEKDIKMTKYTKEYRKTPEYLKEVSFKELVNNINEKWGHTYIDVKVEEDDIEELLEQVRNMEFKNETKG